MFTKVRKERSCSRRQPFNPCEPRRFRGWVVTKRPGEIPTKSLLKAAVNWQKALDFASEAPLISMDGTFAKHVWSVGDDKRCLNAAGTTGGH